MFDIEVGAGTNALVALSHPDPAQPRSESGQDPTGLPAYERFVREVTRRQLLAWLPDEPLRVLDLSVGRPRLLAEMAGCGHEVIHAGRAAEIPPDGAGFARLVCDPNALAWLRDASVDAVVAEGGQLSSTLATEVTVDDVVRVLRPGGRLLLAVDSMISGLSRLAEQSRWAELADAPAADVMLVPEPDGSLRRCFSPDDLTALLREASLEVEWVRCRTLLGTEHVTAALEADPGRLSTMVDTEMSLWPGQPGIATGRCQQLVASAVKGAARSVRDSMTA